MRDEWYHSLDRYRDVPPADWECFEWQMRNSIRNLDELLSVMPLTPSERAAVAHADGRLSMAITPYWAALMDRDSPSCPIRRQAIPVLDEFEVSPNDLVDPLSEDDHMPVPGLIHRYPDRVVLIVTQTCPMYCRFCTRSRIVGQPATTASSQLTPGLDYIRAHPEVRDVLVSGGDPLVLSDSTLDRILGAVRSIPHVEFVRINTRTPVTLPYRVTPALGAILRKHLVWLSLHFNHPKEITDPVRAACNLLADSGIPLSSQSVLLKGINDDPKTLKTLYHELLQLRVRPYYLYQCDPVKGSAHFRTRVDAGISLMSQLRGYTTGHAVPTFVVDAPGGGGKIPLLPDSVVGREDRLIRLRNYAGQVFEYREE
jgi:lysine 2,3-aminomutase